MLDDIPTIGEVRRKALMRYFESLEQIKAATLEQLREVPGMNERSAAEVVRFFRQREKDGETEDRTKGL